MCASVLVAAVRWFRGRPSHSRGTGAAEAAPQAPGRSRLYPGGDFPGRIDLQEVLDRLQRPAGMFLLAEHVPSVPRFCSSLQPAFLLDGPDHGLHPLLQFVLAREMTRRSRLPHVNAVEHVVELLKKSCNIVILTGAGVSRLSSPASIYPYRRARYRPHWESPTSDQRAVGCIRGWKAWG